MKKTQHIAILTTCMVSLLSLPAYADQTTANPQDVDQLIKKINNIFFIYFILVLLLERRYYSRYNYFSCLN